jgi:D-alanyl-D-alanine carboxypeptidase (penicillin-binding protein 5/6)
MKKRGVFLFFLCLILPSLLFPGAVAAEPVITSPGAILMETVTGQILFEQGSHTSLRPASVTKIMTLLLVYEAARSGQVSLDDTVTVSSHAAGYGGSTILLEAGEEITLRNLIKGMCIASGNDAAIAAAEYVGGSVAGFVDLMNRRAAELGMADTHFVNPCGLDADGHVTSAHDVAVMSRELMLNFPEIIEYTTTWHEMMPHVWRSGPGETDMANTNKLIQSYVGMTGLKTGYTRLAKYSLSATATRDGLSLIAVIMGAETKDIRSDEVVSLLDYGFGTYAFFRLEVDGDAVASLPIDGGTEAKMPVLVQGSLDLLLERSETIAAEEVTFHLSLPSSVSAPVAEGDVVGTITYYDGERELGTLPLTAGQDVARMTFVQTFWRLLTF